MLLLSDSDNVGSARVKPNPKARLLFESNLRYLLCGQILQSAEDNPSKIKLSIIFQAVPITDIAILSLVSPPNNGIETPSFSSPVRATITICLPNFTVSDALQAV